jgi:hypothetical protein
MRVMIFSIMFLLSFSRFFVTMSFLIFCLPYSSVVLMISLNLQVEVEYANGSKFNLSAEFLRIHSPAVDGKVRSVGGEKVKKINLCLIIKLMLYPGLHACIQKKKSYHVCSTINIIDHFLWVAFYGHLSGLWLEQFIKWYSRRAGFHWSFVLQKLNILAIYELIYSAFYPIPFHLFESCSC